MFANIDTQTNTKTDTRDYTTCLAETIISLCCNNHTKRGLHKVFKTPWSCSRVFDRFRVTTNELLLTLAGWSRRNNVAFNRTTHRCFKFSDTNRNCLFCWTIVPWHL